MADQIVQYFNSDNGKEYPVTHTRAVFDDSGRALFDILANMHKQVTETEFNNQILNGTIHPTSDTVYFITDDDKTVIKEMYFKGLRFKGNDGSSDIELVEWDIPMVTLSYAKAGASASNGSGLAPSVVITQNSRNKYRNGTYSEWESHEYSLTSPEVTSKSFKGSNLKSGVTVDSQNGAVNYPDATSTSEVTIANVKLTVVVNGETGSSTTIAIKQSAGQNTLVGTTYGALTINSLTYTLGGNKANDTSSPTLSYSHAMTDHYSITGDVSRTETNKGTVSYRITSGADLASINAGTGVVTWKTANSSVNNQKSITVEVSVTVTGTGTSATATQTKTKTVTVYQAVASAQWYVGQITATKAAFAAMDADALVAASTPIPISTKTYPHTLNNSVWFVMVPSGTTVASAYFTQDGQTTNYSADEIVGYFFTASHENVVINGITYNVYGCRNTNFSNASASFTIQ